MVILSVVVISLVGAVVEIPSMPGVMLDASRTMVVQGAERVGRILDYTKAHIVNGDNTVAGTDHLSHCCIVFKYATAVYF